METTTIQPPQCTSVRRYSFQNLRILDIGIARDMIREIVDIAHSHGMKVAVYTDPIGIYDPNHGFGCNLSSNLYVYNEGWTERDDGGNIGPLSFCEVLSSRYAVTASPFGNSKTGYADENSGFSPTTIDTDLNTSENWDDISYHYHITKQVRWLANNYDFDIISVDDTGRLMTGRLDPRKLAFSNDVQILNNIKIWGLSDKVK